MRRAIPGRALTLSAVLVGALMLAPVVWVLVTTVMPAGQRFDLPPHWIPSSLHFGAFSKVFDLIPFGQMFLNSLKITVIITGLSSEIAQTLVTIGVDLSKMNTVGDLQGGIEEAERLLGFEVSRSDDAKR